jgi:hypothetical protein
MLAEAGPEHGDGKDESESEPEARRANGLHIGRSGRGGEEPGEDSGESDESDEKRRERLEDFFRWRGMTND